MYGEITDEKIRAEEASERLGYLAFAALCFGTAILLTDTGSHWAAPYEVLFSIGLVAYYVGYCKCYPVFYEWMMREHCMRHSANYRMTDGHILAFVFSFAWPILWLGRKTVLYIKQLRSQPTRA